MVLECDLFLKLRVTCRSSLLSGSLGGFAERSQRIHFLKILSSRDKNLGPLKAPRCWEAATGLSEGCAQWPWELPGSGGGGSPGLDAVRGASRFSQQDLHVQLHL